MIFENLQNHFSNINSGLHDRFCEIFNKTGPVAYALALGTHNDNNIHTDRHFDNQLLGSGNLKTDITVESST